MAPVAFFTFNRPSCTKRVFAAIRRARPRRLLLVADGPRSAVAGEAQRCREVRSLMKVDWPCRVQRHFSDTNLGCRARISSGLDWVFQQAPEAMVLEDDCLPHPDFFRYSTELLKAYRDDSRVMMVSGSSFDDEAPRRQSYRFSIYPFIWGWASWRRAWKHYDVHARTWPQARKESFLERVFPRNWIARRYWADRFESVWNGSINTWDYQWTFAIWRAGGFCVVPRVKLIENIGAGADATHISEGNPWLLRPVKALGFPLRLPPRMEADRAMDRLVESRLFSRRALLEPKSWLRFLTRRLLAPWRSKA